MKAYILIVHLFLSIICLGQNEIKYKELNLDSIFGKNKGTFVLYSLKGNSYKIYDYERAKQKFAVHSTSKILWSIIGLEEKLIKNEDEMVKWDSVKYPRRELWPKGSDQDQTIKTALNRSVNWYYFELLAKMTPKMIESYLDKFDYQQGYKVEKKNYFGLTFNIRKSALEQIDFLKKFYTNELKISKNTHRIIKEALVYKQAKKQKVYLKTGLGPIKNDNAIGWVVGFIEEKGDVLFFALNVEHEDELKAARLRIEFIMRILKALEMNKQMH